MDYGKIITKAYNITAKNKALWLFGFLAALFGGGSLNFNPGSNLNFTSSSPKTVPNIPNFPEISIILIISLIFLIIVIAIFAWFMQNMSQAALIGMAEEIETTGASSTKSGFRMGFKKWFAYFGVSFLIMFPLIIIFLIICSIFLVPAILLLIKKAILGIILLILAIFIIIIFAVLIFIPAGIIVTYGQRFAVLKNISVIESIGEGYQLFRGKLGDSIILWLINVGIGFGYGIITGILYIIAGVIAIPLFLLVKVSLVFLILAIPAGLIIILVLSFVTGLLLTFVSTYWTVAFRELQSNQS